MSLSLLTTRQTSVLKGIATGKTVKEIAFDLHLSPKTVEYHLTKIRSRLGLNTVARLTAWALASGIISNPYTKSCRVIAREEQQAKLQHCPFLAHA